MRTEVLILAALVLGLAGTLWSVDRTERPNLILIVADDLGYGDLSCYGQQRFATPNLDRMATEGIRFTQAYAGSTVCAPSRGSLFTGLHTGHAAVRGNRDTEEREGFSSNTPLPEGTVTWPSLLRQAGYATGMYGKWGLGAPGNSGEPAKMGFDEFLGYCNQRLAHEYYPSFLVHNREKIDLAPGTWSHAFIWDQAMAFVHAKRDVPFVLLCTVTIPHSKLQVPDEDAAPFRERYADLQGPERISAAAYAGMITRLDTDIGRLLDLLQETGLDQRTLVAFTSDNGPSLSGRQPIGYFESSGGLRGIKRDLYEGGIRVPFIVRWPGRIAGGMVSDHLCAFWDWMPTACDLAGIPAPAGDGISFLPTLMGTTADQRLHESLYWEFHEKGNFRAIRFGNWKAVQADFIAASQGPVELYDLAEDPAETTDVAAANPDIVVQARTLLAASRTPAPMWEGGSARGKGGGTGQP